MNYLIFGATCEIGKNLIYEIIKHDSQPNIFLSSSSSLKLDRLKSFLIEKKIKSRAFICDFEYFSIDSIRFLKDEKFDHIYFFSAFTELEVGKLDNKYLEKSVNVNSLSIIKIINFLFDNIKNHTHSLNFTSTIALCYPKKKNYLYASSKLMVEHYLKTLMHFFSYSKPYINIYRLGFLEGQYTKKYLSVKNSSVANFLFNNQKNKNSKIYYFPRIWFLISIILKLIPRFVLKKLDF